MCMIGEYSFCAYKSLINLIILENVTTIDVNPFPYCVRLQSIEVTKGIPCPSSIECVIFDSWMMELVSYPGGKRGEYAMQKLPQQLVVLRLVGVQHLS